MSEIESRLLEVATEMFSRHRYDQVKTKDIALNAETSEVTLFKYYKSKELLFKKVVEQKMGHLNIKASVDQFTYEDFDKDIRQFANALLSELIEKKEVLRMIFKVDSDMIKKNRLYYEDPMYIILLPCIDRYYEEELISKKPVDITMLFVKTIKGYGMQFISGEISKKNFHELTECFLNMYIQFVTN